MAAASDSPKMNLNLDALEREGGDPEPYAFTLKGKRYVIEDIQNHDWQELENTSIESNADSLKMMLGEEQFAKFAEHKLPQWKIDHLAKAVEEHFGLGSAGNDDASSTS